jgi:hypothetical protein
VQVWFSRGIVVTAEVTGVMIVVAFGNGGVTAVHPPRSISTMQMTVNTIAGLSMEWIIGYKIIKQGGTESGRSSS